VSHVIPTKTTDSGADDALKVLEQVSSKLTWR